MRLLALIAFALLLTACSSSPLSTPVTTSSVNGSVPNTVPATGWVIFAESVSTQGDGTLAFEGPFLAAEIQPDGRFSSELPDLTAGELSAWCDMPGSVAVMGSLVIADTATPTLPEDITADIYLGLEDGTRVNWLYADAAFQYSGRCRAMDMSLNLAAGWNIVVSVPTSDPSVYTLHTMPIPSSASWRVEVN